VPREDTRKLKLLTCHSETLQPEEAFSKRDRHADPTAIGFILLVVFIALKA
jgi:hypothetical protein